MLFIIGVGGFVSSFHKVWPNSFTEALARNMDHAGWEGFYFLDLIFPLFLFLVGLLLPLVLLGRVERGISRGKLYLHITKRTRVLIFLGLVNYGLLRFDLDTMRWSSVLGRIGICYFIASLLDQKLIPRALGFGLYDRQGVLSTCTALPTTLIGVLAGHWLSSGRTVNQKTVGFIIAGLPRWQQAGYGDSSFLSAEMYGQVHSCFILPAGASCCWPFSTGSSM
jgi:predicted acyltransferase